MFFKSKTNHNILNNVTDTNIKVIEIYKKGSKTFQLYCDVKKETQ
jgi:hypothetical protein